MKIKQEDINKIIELVDKFKEDVSHPQFLLEDAVTEVLGDEGLKEFEEIKTINYDANRWSIPVEIIFKIGDFYIKGGYNKPATESQEGQDTDVYYVQVKPVEEIVINYKEVSNE